MDSTILTIIVSGIVSVILLVAGKFLEKWINKNKDDATVGLTSADTNLKTAELVKKYQEMVGDQADENSELTSRLKIEEGEKKALAMALKQMESRINDIEKEHREEIKRLEEKFDIERKENEAWRDWAKRLSMQIQSLGFVPVPFDVEDAKRNGYSMGDCGSYPVKEVK